MSLTPLEAVRAGPISEPYYNGAFVQLENVLKFSVLSKKQQ